MSGLVRAATYLIAASWPGWTARRPQAYTESHRLFDLLLRAFAPEMGIDVERLAITVDGDEIVGYAILPAGVEPAPAILMSNDLEPRRSTPPGISPIAVFTAGGYR